jgi:hypothetical protein
MTIRNVFVLLTFVAAMFVPGRILRLITHQPYGSVAWAQEATEAEQPEDVTSEPDVAPPSIAGTWSGELNDASFGLHTFTLDIFQKKAKIRGDFLIDSVKQGAFKGKIEVDQTTVTLELKRHHCAVAATASLSNSNTKLIGTYTSKHCNNASSGNFDLTKQ